jgi:hypothetical protein
MAKPFDATLNLLIDIRPEDWADCFARLAGIPPGPSVVVDTDLAVSLQADKVFRIDGSKPSLLHLELEANPRLGIPRELMRYNIIRLSTTSMICRSGPCLCCCARRHLRAI